jgi:hypothetical protein
MSHNLRSRWKWIFVFAFILFVFGGIVLGMFYDFGPIRSYTVFIRIPEIVEIPQGTLITKSGIEIGAVETVAYPENRTTVVRTNIFRRFELYGSDIVWLIGQGHGKHMEIRTRTDIKGNELSVPRIIKDGEMVDGIVVQVE